jgi:HPt (histidine-containing phosphotransfer) domain-containing protein
VSATVQNHADEQRNPVRDNPIDETVLDGLRRLQTKARPDFAAKIIGLYLDGTPGVLNELRTAARAGDMPALRTANHNLLSASAAVGASYVAALCHDMDVTMRAGSLSDAAQRVEAIAEEYKRVEVALRIWQAWSGLRLRVRLANCPR